MFQQFLDESYFNNTIRSYLIVLGIIGFTLLIKRLLSKYLAGLIAKLIARKGKPFNTKRFQDHVLSPIEFFLLVMVVIFTLESLNYPEIFDFQIHHIPFSRILEGIANTVMIGSFIWLCIRLLEYVADLLHEKALLTEDRTDDQLIIFFKDLFKVIIGIIGFLLIIRFGFGQQIGPLLTSLSIVGAALALAFRESLENLIASFIIFFDKPFSVGDLVKVQSVNGTVERIGLRSTRIRTTDKTYVTVPNKQMVDTILDNQTLRSHRHVNMTIEVGLSATASQLEQLVKDIDALISGELIADKTVYLSETGQKAHVITIDYFTNMEQSMKAFYQLKQGINLAIIALIEKSGVELAASSPDIVVTQK